jgi:hypothetical protein
MDVLTYPKTMTWHLTRQIKNEQNTIIESVSFEPENLRVHLTDGRVLSVPLDWFPLLQTSSQLDKERFQIHDDGSSILWKEIGQQITLRELLMGADPCEQCWYRVSYYK